MGVSDHSGELRGTVCVCVSVWLQVFTLLMSSMSTVTYKYICSVLALLTPRSMALEQAWIFSCSWASLSVGAEPSAAPLLHLRSAPDVQKPRGTNIAMAQTYCFEKLLNHCDEQRVHFPNDFSKQIFDKIPHWNLIMKLTAFKGQKDMLLSQAIPYLSSAMQ